MTGQTRAAIQAAHMTIYETPIEFDWDLHPHLNEAEACEAAKLVEQLQKEHYDHAKALEKETNQ